MLICKESVSQVSGVSHDEGWPVRFTNTRLGVAATRHVRLLPFSPFRL